MSTPLLETRGVWQRFGGLVANSDVSISVGRGEIVGLIGPNGAGKSTLFNLITGHLQPTRGRIFFADRDITGQPQHAELPLKPGWHTVRLGRVNSQVAQLGGVK